MCVCVCVCVHFCYSTMTQLCTARVSVARQPHLKTLSNQNMCPTVSAGSQLEELCCCGSFRFLGATSTSIGSENEHTCMVLWKRVHFHEHAAAESFLTSHSLSCVVYLLTHKVHASSWLWAASRVCRLLLLLWYLCSTTH